MEKHTFNDYKNIIDKYKDKINNKINICYYSYYSLITYEYKNNNISIKDYLLLINHIFLQNNFVLDFYFITKTPKNKNSYMLMTENRKILSLLLFDYNIKEYKELKKYFIKHKNDLYIISIKLKRYFNNKNFIDIFLDKYIKLFRNIPFVFIYTYNSDLNKFISDYYIHQYNNFIYITNYLHYNAYLFIDNKNSEAYYNKFQITHFKGFPDNNIIKKLFYYNKIKYEFIKFCVMIKLIFQ